MLSDSNKAQLGNYPTRTTNEYNYWYRKNTEKGKEYKKRTNDNHYIRHSKSPVITRGRLEIKRKLQKK